MKKLNSLLILTMVIGFLASCSSDDSNDISLAEQQNQAEERVIPTSEISSGVVIDRATSKSGTAPAPSGDLDFQIDTEEQEAFQATGFKIKFNSNDNISGAYIQLKDADGNKVDGYFDVPLSFFRGTKKSIKNKRKNSLAKLSKSFQVGDYEIDVDFEDTLNEGRFCYEICVYDEQGNISQIEEVCVEIEAWGGNDAIAGEWLFDRFEPNLGDDDVAFIECQSGQTLEAAYENYQKDDWILALNSDGSYFENYHEISQELNFDASSESCTAVYNDEVNESNEKYLGNWAFNEDNQTLTIVDFKYENLIDDSNNEDYEDGELYFEGVKAEVVNNELVLSEAFNDGDADVTINIIFKRR